MRTLTQITAGLAWFFFALACAFTLIDGVLFSEGPHGFFPTAALFGFLVLGTVSFCTFWLARRLAGAPWLGTRFGRAHAAVLAAAYLSISLLLLVR